MKIYNPIDTRSPIVLISVIITAVSAVTVLFTCMILAPEIVLMIFGLVMLAGVINTIKYIFTGKGFVE